jgi:hypothetical protein
VPQQPILEQNVFPEQGPLPQANGADFGAQVGAATEGLGQQVQRTGDVIADNVLRWQGLKNQATANDLDVQFQGDLGTLEDKFYSLKGKAAADAYPQFQQDLQALRDKYMGISPNPVVRNMLGSTVNYSIGRSLRSGGQFSGEQTRNWMIDAGQSRIQSLQYNAVKRYNDDDYAKTAQAAIDAGIEDLGATQGWSPEHIALAKEQAADKLLADRQQAALDNLKGQPVADVMHSLVQDGTPAGSGQNGPVGGAAYRTAVVATEFGSGQNDPNNPHQGPVQADDAWWARFGAGGDRNKMPDALAALDRETAENAPKLEAALGRKVTDADLYLAHQQGLAGAIALLKNPDKPAAESVPLANIAANLPPGSPDASTITGQQFSDIWAKGFDQSGGVMANNPASRNNQIDSSIAILSDAQKMALAKDTIAAWHTQDAAFREQTRFQQEQQAKAAKDQYDAVMTQAKGVMAANWANPGKNPPLNIAQFSQTPFGKAHPEAVTDLINYAKNFNNKPDNDKTVTAQLYRDWLDGKAGADDFQQHYAPKDGTLGDISHESLDWLMGLTKGKNDPYAEATKGLKSKFISDTESKYLGDTKELSPDSKQRFNIDFEAKWEAFNAAGKDPRALVTPGNPDYFGTPANLSNYSQTAKDQLDAEAAAQAEAANPTLFGSPMAYLKKTADMIRQYGYAPPPLGGEALPEGIPEGSTYAGTSKVDGSPLYRLPKALGGGLVKAKGQSAPAATPAPPQAPVAEGAVKVQQPDGGWPSATAMQALHLTPQEQNLYQHHIDNMEQGKAVKNTDGSVSTLLQMSVEHDGKFYNIPSVWDGKELSPKEAVKRAAAEGWDKWPSYGSEAEAEARYAQMHDALEGDIGETTPADTGPVVPSGQ